MLYRWYWRHRAVTGGYIAAPRRLNFKRLYSSDSLQLFRFIRTVKKPLQGINMFSLRTSFSRFALIACLAVPAAAWSQTIYVTIAPPPLPVYVQPPIPSDGYLWSPGYWEYDAGDYYWVPGTWVRPPAVGLLWTPGYWAWNNGFYVFNRGYWAPRVGFYGGVNYGYGYNGSGYHGGYWRGGAFNYNRYTNNFGRRHITHVYNKKVVNNITINRISYNGGRGGVNARPNAHQQNYARQKHIAPTKVQIQHAHSAIGNREQCASINHGHPPIAATHRPGRFNGNGVVSSRRSDGQTSARPQQRVTTHPRDTRTDSQHLQSNPKPDAHNARPEFNNVQQNRPSANRVQEQAQPAQLQQREQQQREQAQQREQQWREHVQQRDQQQREQVQQRQQQRREQVQQRDQQRAARPQPQRPPQSQVRPALSQQREPARSAHQQVQHPQAQRPAQARGSSEERRQRGQPRREDRRHD